MKKLIVVEGLSGSGKSSFSRLLSSALNLEYLNLDVIAKSLYENKSVIEQLRTIFPAFIFGEEKVNYKELGKIVFNDINKMKELENILYPNLVDKVNELVEKSLNGCVLDGIKVHETELFNKASFKIFVNRDNEKRISSIMKRDNISEEMARSRDKAISFEGIKYDYLIDNSGSLNDLKDEIPFVINEILKGETCLYAGSFDPLTNGHLELIRKASKDYDYVFVGIGNNPNKRRNYDKDEMRDLINDVLRKEDINNCYCFNYDGYTGEVSNKLKINCLVRGIRNKEDEVSEKRIADYNYTNYNLSTKYYYIEGKEMVSSTLVRDNIRENKSVTGLVPFMIEKYLKYKRLENDINVNKHSSIRIGNIYIDPFKIEENKKDAKYIFITHSHYDHMSIEDIEKVSNDETIFVGPNDVINELKKKFENKFIVVKPNNHYQIHDMSFETFPSYNINKQFHPFSNGWIGYVINVNDVKYAILGDSDLTEEVKNVNCDVLFVPIGGTYTMNANEASELTNVVNPKLVIPVHYNDIVGSKDDEEVFLKGIKEIDYKLFL